MKFENIRVYNFENALRGMRNPKNSWHLSDSSYGLGSFEESLMARDQVRDKWLELMPFELESEEGQTVFSTLSQALLNNGIINIGTNCVEWAFIGPNDMKLAQQLIMGGSEHRKFLRQIFVTVDITAPLYWWKEFDTYKVGTVANSTSTMHKLTSKPIAIDSFEIDDFNNIPYPEESQREGVKTPCDPDFIQMCLIPYLEYLRQSYLLLIDDGKTEEAKIVWKELVRWLPNGWLQTRTVTMNYENLLAMCSKSQRRYHKLTEWSGDGDNFTMSSFLKFARSLPYASDFVFLDEQVSN